jgi:hypothetical protein
MVQITFSPPVVGDHSGVLSLGSNAPGAPVSVTLSGSGTAAISQPCSINVTFAVLVTAKARGGGGSMNFLALGGLLIALLSRLIRRRGGIALLLALPSRRSLFSQYSV